MRHLLAAVMLGLVGCGPTVKPTPDAGPDTSCGIDCAAQNRYGLIARRCFEYSNDPLNGQDPAALGALVLPVTKLEGGLDVMPVEYLQLGQLRMRDSFAIKNGDLYLARREFSGGRSVTYRDASSAIVGVKWLGMGTGAGETFSTDTQAFVVNQSGVGTTEATSYRVTTDTATFSELRTPLMTYDAGLKILVGELVGGSTAQHGADPRRVYVPDVGFVVLASAFSISGGTPTPLSVQRIRDMGAPDAGVDCSLGGP